MHIGAVDLATRTPLPSVTLLTLRTFPTHRWQCSHHQVHVTVRDALYLEGHDQRIHPHPSSSEDKISNFHNTRKELSCPTPPNRNLWIVYKAPRTEFRCCFPTSSGVYLGSHPVVRRRKHGPNQGLDLTHVSLHRLESGQEQLAESSEGYRNKGGTGVK